MTLNSARQAAIARFTSRRSRYGSAMNSIAPLSRRWTGGKRSSAALDAAERGRLLGELRRLGFQTDRPQGGELASLVKSHRGTASSGLAK